MVLSAIVAAVFLKATVHRIKPGQIGLVTLFGADRGTIGPGLHFLNVHARVQVVEQVAQISFGKPVEILTPTGPVSLNGRGSWEGGSGFAMSSSPLAPGTAAIISQGPVAIRWVFVEPADVGGERR